MPAEENLTGTRRDQLSRRRCHRIDVECLTGGSDVDLQADLVDDENEIRCRSGKRCDMKVDRVRYLFAHKADGIDVADARDYLFGVIEREFKRNAESHGCGRPRTGL